MDEILDKLEVLASEAFQDLAIAYSQSVDDIIQDLNAFSDLGYHDWDIVDTGRLLASKIAEINSNQAQFSWNPQDPESKVYYARSVWTGFMSFGGSYKPGRHWPERAAYNMEQKGITQVYADLLSQKGLAVSIVTKAEDDLDI